MTEKRPDKVEICSEPAGLRAFSESENQWVTDRQKMLAGQFMSPENTVRYIHRGEVKHDGTDEDEGGTMQPHVATRTIHFKDVKNNDLNAWADGLIKMADELNESVMGMMFHAIDASTEKSGNVVDAQKAGSFPNAFLETMETIEFGVDRNGKVNMPIWAVPPGVAEKQIAALKAQPQEFQARVEEVKARKAKEALEREAERKARFRCRE